MNKKINPHAQRKLETIAVERLDAAIGLVHDAIKGFIHAGHDTSPPQRSAERIRSALISLYAVRWAPFQPGEGE